MKKIMLLAFFSVLLLLTGCIEIPLGEGETLTISTDGINIETNETENEDENNGNNNVNQDENNQNSAGSQNEEENDSNTNEVSNTGNKNENNEEVNEMECQEEYDSLLESIPKNFPVPDCIQDVKTTQEKNDDNTYYRGNYLTNDSWTDVRDLYKEYLENEYSIMSEKEGPDNISLKYKDDVIDLKISVSEHNEEETYVKFWFRDFN